ncbi:MAG: serine/threonine protein phosphatase [Rhodobacteraceae bacterium]|nr:serine/threonine protein phosphatase [Paracoccaceae bacterium]
MSDPIYCLGDIHGQTEFLDRALELIEKDGGADAEIVFLGDLVDRGPDSRGVIERLISGHEKGRNWHVIKGNHDRMFSRFVRTGDQHDAQILSGLGWMHPRLGGPATLASYGVPDCADMPLHEAYQAAAVAVPEDHLAFLESLPTYLERDGLLFVHAGILPEVPLADQIEDNLIWIRRAFHEYTAPHPWLVVHGHTALEYPEHFGNRIDLDGGAGYGRPIHPAVFEGTKCWLLTDHGRVPLTA